MGTSLKSIDKKFHKNIRWLYQGLFLLLPFVVLNSIIDPVLLPRLLILSLFIGCISILIANQKISFPFINIFKNYLPLGILLIYICLMIVSASESITLSESIFQITKFIVLIVFFFLTVVLLSNQFLNIQTLTDCIFYFTILSISIGLWQIISIVLSHHSVLENIQSIKSTFGNKNLFASIILFTLPFNLYRLKSQIKWRKLNYAVLALTLLFLWLLQSRAAILGLFIYALFLLFLTLTFKNSKENNIFSVKTISFFLIGLLILVSMTFIFRKQLTSLFNLHTGLIRLELWKNTLMMIKEHPLVGVGPGNWQILFPKYGLGNFDLAEIQNGMTTFQRPHNDFLWIFSETGIPGLICYLLLFIVSFKFGFRLLKSVSDNNSQALYKHLLSGLAAYLTVSFFDFPIERIEHQILLFTMLAIISSDYILKNNPKKDLPTKTIQVRSLIAFIIPVMLFSLVITCSRLIGEYHTRKLISAHHHNNWKTMISESDKAMNMFYQLDPTSAPISWYKGVALFATENIKTANSSFENAYYTHPYNLHVLNNLASSYEKLGDHEKAEQYYKEALSIFPAFDEARLNLSAVYYNKGLFEKAFIIIDQCDTNCIDPKYLIFLPAILNEKAKIILQKATPMDDKRFRFRSFSNDKLLEIYFLSKRKNIRFEDEIVTQLNQPV